MPRIFTGLEVPERVAQSLSMLRGGLPGARWIDPENYHLTLRFIGDVDDQTAREVASLLGRVRRQPFELRFDALSSFGGRRPRAVIATLAQTAALMELQAEHERLMQRVGLEPEGRKFTPHVTLARLRDSSSRQVADYLAARALIDAPPFAVSRFVLFSSRASSRRRTVCGGSGLPVGGLTAWISNSCLPAFMPVTTRWSLPETSNTIRRKRALSTCWQNWKRACASIGWRASRRRSVGCSALANAGRSRSRASTCSARSAAARPC